MTIDFAWGRPGVYALVESGCRTIVVVDVLRFTTAVDVGVSRGAAIYPYRWHDGTEHAYAKSHGAELAVKGFDVDNDHPWSLSPVGLARIPAGTKLVLPSPNGATIAFEAAARGERRPALREQRAIVPALLAQRPVRARQPALLGGDRLVDLGDPLHPARPHPGLQVRLDRALREPRPAGDGLTESGRPVEILLDQAFRCAAVHRSPF